MVLVHCCPLDKCNNKILTENLCSCSRWFVGKQKDLIYSSAFYIESEMNSIRLYCCLEITSMMRLSYRIYRIYLLLLDIFTLLLESLGMTVLVPPARQASRWNDCGFRVR